MSGNTITQVIQIPSGLTAAETLAYIQSVYSVYLGAVTGGTEVSIVVSATHITIVTDYPLAVVPTTKPPAGYVPPVTTTGGSYEPPSGGIITIPTTSNPNVPAGQESSVLITFEQTAGSYYWGSPLGLSNNGIVMPSTSKFLIGGSISGTNVVAMSNDEGVTWSVIGYPPILIQEMTEAGAGHSAVIVGRDATKVNYVQSSNYGVTWVTSSYSGWLGTGSTGFYD